MRGFRQWRWHLDEVYVKINGEMHYLWRAVDQRGGAGGIRTHDTLLTYTHFPGVRLRPLGHRSACTGDGAA